MQVKKIHGNLPSECIFNIVNADKFQIITVDKNFAYIKSTFFIYIVFIHIHIGSFQYFHLLFTVNRINGLCKRILFSCFNLNKGNYFLILGYDIYFAVRLFIISGNNFILMLFQIFCGISLSLITCLFSSKIISYYIFSSRSSVCDTYTVRI